MKSLSSLTLCTLLLLSTPFAQATENKVKPALTVTVTLPQEQKLPMTLTANGDIAAWQEVQVSSEVNGLRLINLAVEIGDEVKKGQLLAEFDTAFLKLDIEQAKASLQEAEAHLREVGLDAERVRQLQGSGALSEREVAQRLSAEEMAKAKVASTKAALASLQLRLQRSRVLAPEAGVISARNATLGAVAGAGTELFRLIRQNRLEWRAKVPAADLGKLKIGHIAKLTLDNGQTLSGKIRKIAPALDTRERIALVYVDLAGTNKIQAGMFAQGRFEFGNSPAMTLPHQAIVIRDGFSYVFTVNAQQQAKRIKVQTGRRVGTQVELLTPISGQYVVVQGAGFLNDGDVVRVAK